MQENQAPPDLTERGWHVGLLMVLTLAAALRWPGIDDPFGGDVQGWTGAFYAAIGHNMLDLGTLAPIVNPLPTADVAVAYAHHPPLTSWAVALAIWLIGPTEAAARVPFFLASLLTVLWAARLCRDQIGTRTAGLIGALLLATCPVAAFYGHQVEVVGSLLLLGLLGSVLSYAAYQKRPDVTRAARLAAWLTFVILADWPGLILCAVLFAHAALVRRSIRLAVIVASTTCAILASVVLWLVSLAPSDGWALLSSKLYQRSFLLVDDQGQPFGLRELLKTYVKYHYYMIGPSLVGLALVWLVWPRRRVSTGLAPGTLLSFTVIFLGVACQSMHQHDFWLHPVAGAYAVVGAAALARTRLRPRLALALAIVVAAGSAFTLHQTRDFRAQWPSGPPRAATHRTLAPWVAETVPREDYVAVIDATRWPTLPYYLGRRMVAIDSIEELERIRAQPVQDATTWIRIPAAKPPAWLLLTKKLPEGTPHELARREGSYWLYRLREEKR